MVKTKGMNRTLFYGIIVVVAVVLLVGGVVFVPKVWGFVEKTFFTKPGQDKNETDGEEGPNLPPIANLKTKGDRSVYKVGDLVELDGNASEDPGYKNKSNKGIFSYRWDFGDGSPPDSTLIGNYTYIYSKAGIFTVVLTVSDEQGLTDTANLTLKVVPEDETIGTATAILLANPVAGVIPNSTHVNFTVKEDAKMVNLTITLTGANIRETQSSRLEVVLFNPYEDVVYNQTVNVIIVQQLNWELFEEEISVPGEYDLRIRCLGGMALVTVEGTVTYL